MTSRRGFATDSSLLLGAAALASLALLGGRYTASFAGDEELSASSDGAGLL